MDSFFSGVQLHFTIDRKTFFHSFFTRSIIFHSSLSLVFPVYQTLSSDSIGRKQERVLREQNKFRSLKTLVHTFFMACARQRQHNFHSKWIRCGSGFFHDTVPSCAGCYTGQSRGRCCYAFSKQGHKFSIGQRRSRIGNCQLQKIPLFFAG